MQPSASFHTRPSLLLRLREPQDVDAWKEFVLIYGPVILRWCQRKGLQGADADDVAQMVLLRLARRMQTFTYDPAQGSFRAYLHTLARYAMNDFFAEQTERGSGDTGVLASLETLAARDELSTELDETFDHEVLSEALIRVQKRVEAQTWLAFQLTAVLGEAAAVASTKSGMSIAGIYKAKSRVIKLLKEEIALLEANSESSSRVYSLLSLT